MILRARAIWARKGRVITDGALQVCGDKIGKLGRRDEVVPDEGEPVIDIGESIVFPAFVNAHCHLDYTGLAGELTPGNSFTDWVKQIVEVKRTLTQEEHESAWLAGAGMLMQSGCGTVANIESIPGMFARLANQTPLQVCPFTEIIGYNEDDVCEALELARRELSCNELLALVAGISPHAPYTTTPKSLSALAGLADELNVPTAIHVSESMDEWRMFTDSGGALFDSMRALGRPSSDCGLGTPVEHVSRSQGLAKRTLVIHANQLGESDYGLLAKPGVSVVHCPGSHAWFGHEKFEYERLAKAGVNICLGTDSLASSSGNVSAQGLTMFNEMKRFSNQYPEVSSDEIIGMATWNGAAALGLRDVLGQLIEGAFANLAIIPLTNPLADVSDLIVNHAGPVGSLMIAGKRVFSCPKTIAN